VRYQDDRGERSAKARVLTLAVILLLGVVALRLFHLQILQAERLREISDNNRIRTEYIPALRGRILDRNGEVLADNTPSFTAVLDPLLSDYRESPEKLDATVRALSALLGIDAERAIAKVEARMYRAPLGVRIKGNLTDREVAGIEEAAADLPGVRVEARPQRRYPNATLAAHLLGTVGEVTERELRESPGRYRVGDFVGRTGVEARYDDVLRGKDGVRQTQVDALGRRVGLFGGIEKIPPRAGRDLKLALDLDLQRFVEQALAQYPRGCAVVVDVTDGGVLALASRPSFDPNLFARGLTPQEWRELGEDSGHPLLNRCIQARYPPGSTFKLLTAMAALEEGVVDPADRPVNCVGYYVLGNRKYGCWKVGGHGRVDMNQAIAQSCSSYFFHLGKLLGVEGVSRWAFRLGFPGKTGVDLPGESECFAPDSDWYDERYGPGGWTQGLALNLAIGQGELLATPLKLVTLAMAIGGRGRWPTPRVVLDAPVKWNSWDISQSTLDVVRRGMFEVVQGKRGSGRQAFVPGIAVGGKTGTAQNPHGDDHSIFVGFAPWDDPVVAVAVYLENAGHGGQHAAPLAGEILRFYFGRPVADTEPVPGVEAADEAESAATGAGPEEPRPGALRTVGGAE